MLESREELARYVDAVLMALKQATALAEGLPSEECDDLLARLAIVREVAGGNADHGCSEGPMRLRPDAARTLATILAPLSDLEDELCETLREGSEEEKKRFANLVGWLFFEVRRPLSEVQLNVKDPGQG